MAFWNLVKASALSYKKFEGLDRPTPNQAKELLKSAWNFLSGCLSQLPAGGSDCSSQRQPISAACLCCLSLLPVAAAAWLPLLHGRLRGDPKKIPGCCTKVAGGSTKAPGGSTKAPKRFHEVLGGSRRPQEVPHKPPKGSTKIPRSSTKMPGFSAKAPGCVTKTPNSSIEAPGGSTKAPRGSTKLDSWTLGPSDLCLAVQYSL